MSKSLAELLGPDEHVMLQTRQHWWVLFVDGALQIVGLLLFGAALIITTSRDWFDDHRAGGWIVNACWVVFALLTAVILWKIICWLAERFTITTTKVVYEQGVFQRDVISIPLVKLDEMTLVQPLIGRMLGFGRLEVRNAAGGKAPLAGLEYLPRPKELYRTITERARHQRLLEGGGYEDADGDGLVDEAPRTKRSQTVKPAAASSEISPVGPANGEPQHRHDAVEVDTRVDPVGPHIVTTETVDTGDVGAGSDTGGDSGGGDSGGE